MHADHVREEGRCHDVGVSGFGGGVRVEVDRVGFTDGVGVLLDVPPANVEDVTGESALRPLPGFFGDDSHQAILLLCTRRGARGEGPEI